MKKLLMCLLLIFVFSACFALKTAKNFTAKDINNKTIKLAELLKKGPVLLDFWATWCSPCKKSLPELSKLADKYPQISVVTVSVDKASKEGKARSYIKADKYKFIKLFDTDKTIQKAFQVKNVPHTVLINQKREIVFTHNSYKSGDAKIIAMEIEKLLKPQEVKK